MAYRILFYDVVSDRRRGRLHKGLRSMLLPVQKSAFEGWLDHRALRDLLALVHDEIDPSEDKVRLVTLCGRCQRRLITLGDMPRPLTEDEVVLLALEERTA